MLASELPLTGMENVIVVFGSEGSGLEGDVYSLSNYNVIIPPQLDVSKVNKDAYKLVESLNVGVSTGIILHSVKQKMN